jgi:hypothetical protein
MSTKEFNAVRPPQSDLPEEVLDQLTFEPETLATDWISESEAATLLGLYTRDMRALRKRGDGPVHYDYPHQRGVLYRKQDVLAYQECFRCGVDWELALKVTVATNRQLTELTQDYEKLRTLVEDVVTKMLADLGGGEEEAGEG